MDMEMSTLPFATLLKNLADGNQRERLLALSRIMSRPAERGQAFAALCTLLDDPDELLCAAAIRALGALRNPQAIQPLTHLLNQSSFSLREDVLDALIALGDTQGVPHAIALVLRGEDDGLREQAVRALRRRARAQVVGPLVATSEDADPHWRELAGTALGSPSQRETATPLIAALSHENESVRDIAAEALGLLGDAQAVDPLIALLSDPSEDIRETAAQALGQLGDVRAVEPLIAALELDCSGAIEALANLGDARATRPLLAVSWRDTEGATAIAEALIRLDNPQLFDLLMADLAIPNSYERMSAAHVLGFWAMLALLSH